MLPASKIRIPQSHSRTVSFETRALELCNVRVQTMSEPRSLRVQQVNKRTRIRARMPLALATETIKTPVTLHRVPTRRCCAPPVSPFNLR